MALLGIAAGVSILTGGVADALVVLGVMGINTIIGYTTESRAEKTLESLKGLIRPSARVIREGVCRDIPMERIVPGDLVALRPGSYVPADSRLVDATHLTVDESALTGESMPVSEGLPRVDGKSYPPRRQGEHGPHGNARHRGARGLPWWWPREAIPK